MGDGTEGFITASHCTRKAGGTETTTYENGSDFIGVEHIDPQYWGCSRGMRCRYSDAAFVKWDFHFADYSRGYVMKTNHNFGSIDISGDFDVYDDWHPPMINAAVGVVLHKVAWKTGWTTGEVTESCVDVVNAEGDWYLCQDLFDANSAEGDSGAPVFMRWSNPGGNPDFIVPQGILSGGTTQGYIVMSHITSVQWEIGSFTTCRPNACGAL